MPETDIILVIVPTTGIRTVHGELVPTKNGSIQLEMAAKLLRGYPNSRLVITGGKRRNPENSEAAVYYRVFEALYDDQKKKLLPFVAESLVTPHDAREVVSRLMRGAIGIAMRCVKRVIPVGHSDHTERFGKAFQVFAGENCPPITPVTDFPTEPPAYDAKIKERLAKLDEKDPKWEDWPTLLARIYSVVRAPLYDRRPLEG